MDSDLQRVEEEAFRYLGQTRKWTSFISIILFLFIVLILAGGVYGYMTFAETEPSAVIGIIPLMILATLNCIPVYYLYRFSVWSKRAVKNSETKAFTQAMKYLKYHYRYLGMMLVIAILLYLMVSAMVIGNNGFARGS